MIFGGPGSENIVLEVRGGFGEVLERVYEVQEVSQRGRGSSRGGGGSLTGGGFQVP